MPIEYTFEDLDALRAAWQETFNESMPMGFEIGPSQVPMMKECIETGSRAPLERYIASLGDVVY